MCIERNRILGGVASPAFFFCIEQILNMNIRNAEYICTRYLHASGAQKEQNAADSVFACFQLCAWIGSPISFKSCDLSNVKKLKSFLTFYKKQLCTKKTNYNQRGPLWSIYVPQFNIVITLKTKICENYSVYTASRECGLE